jgi:hypothetical protein
LVETPSACVQIERLLSNNSVFIQTGLYAAVDLARMCCRNSAKRVAKRPNVIEIEMSSKWQRRRASHIRTAQRAFLGSWGAFGNLADLGLGIAVMTIVRSFSKAIWRES